MGAPAAPTEASPATPRAGPAAAPVVASVRRAVGAIGRLSPKPAVDTAGRGTPPATTSQFRTDSARRADRRRL